jgi:PrtD family type I secretion system ABC transporter
MQQNTLLKDTLSSCKRAFFVVAVFGLCINLLMLTSPLYMMQVFDRVITSRNTDTLVMLMLVAGVALLTLALLEGVRSYIMVRISNWLDVRLGGITLTGSITQALRAGRDPSIQTLRDLTTFRTFLAGPSMFPIMDAPFAPIFLAVMFMLHPILGVIALVGAVILFALAVTNELTTRNLLMQAGGRSIAAMNQAEAATRNADVIEAMGMMPYLIKRWNSRNSEAMALQAKASDRSGLISSTSKFVRFCLQIGVMSAGAWLAIKGEMSPGSMIAGSIIMGRALAPVEQAIGSWKSLLSARAAYGRLKSQLENTQVRGEAMPLPAPKGKLDVEGVAYVHGQASDPIFKSVNFSLNPGESLGIIGPTAAGKTTLARLLVGNLVPRAGTVRLDSMDIFAWEADDRGRHIGYLPQDVELFAGTIQENIARMDDGDPEAVVKAAQRAGVHEMVLRLEKGYDTEIGDGGAALSGGQRQRIALARALYGDPRFLVFDEPNASLDSDGEEALLAAIKSLGEEGCTVIVIAHRPSVLRFVDKLLVLRDGIVAAFGPREEVLEQLQGVAAPIEPPSAPKVIDAEPIKPKAARIQDTSGPQTKTQKPESNSAGNPSGFRPSLNINSTNKKQARRGKGTPNPKVPESLVPDTKLKTTVPNGQTDIGEIEALPQEKGKNK